MSDSIVTTLRPRLRAGAALRGGAPSCADDDLRGQLARAADGDVASFLDFYDATCALVWRLEMCRHRDPATAEDAALARYVEAWRRAAHHGGSGLGPRAWLLGLAPARDGCAPARRVGA